MSALNAAQRRLDRALGRLESAIARPEARARVRDAGATSGDVDGLRVECLALQRALDDSQRDNDELRRLADDVALRLDGAIAELGTILDS